MTRRSNPFSRALGALVVAAALLFAGAAGAAEIKGTVTAVAGTTVTIALKSDLRPNVGDKVKISFKTADDEIPVGTWRVSKVEGATVTATVVEAEGEATIDMTAVIYSAAPKATTVRKDIPPPATPARLDDNAARAAYNRGDYATAVREFRPLAEQGHAPSQFNLGVLYATGQGVAQDYAEAVRWYRKAAAQGDAKAQNNLGLMYRNGRGVARDYREAVKWCRRAAEQGRARAQNNLGVMYDMGRGVPQDHSEAVRWWSKAAEQGHAAEAVKWYRKAASQGHEKAQRFLRKRGLTW